jgi:hypothetical protein
MTTEFPDHTIRLAWTPEKIAARIITLQIVQTAEPEIAGLISINSLQYIRDGASILIQWTAGNSKIYPIIPEKTGSGTQPYKTLFILGNTVNIFIGEPVLTAKIEKTGMLRLLAHQPATYEKANHPYNPPGAQHGIR